MTHRLRLAVVPTGMSGIWIPRLFFLAQWRLSISSVEHTVAVIKKISGGSSASESGVVMAEDESGDDQIAPGGLKVWLWEGSGGIHVMSSIGG